MTTASDSSPVLVDSSGWVEWVAGGPKAPAFEPSLRQESRLVVPTIVVYEVYRKLQREHGRTLSEAFLSTVLRCQVVALDIGLAVAACTASLDHRLAMADAIIYATAQSCEALLVTSDPHFTGLPGVQII